MTRVFSPSNGGGLEHKASNGKLANGKLPHGKSGRADSSHQIAEALDDGEVVAQVQETKKRRMRRQRSAPDSKTLFWTVDWLNGRWTTVFFGRLIGWLMNYLLVGWFCFSEADKTASQLTLWKSPLKTARYSVLESYCLLQEYGSK